MIKRAIGGLLIITSIIAGMAVGVLLFLRVEPSGEQTNPYEYNIEEFRAVPADLLRYVETNRTQPEVKGLHGLAVDSADRIYVVGAAVAIFDKAGQPAGGFSLSEPGLCLAVDGQGNVFVGMTNHIEVFGMDGTRKATWESLGEQALVTSVAIGSNDVFVADFGSRLVWRFDGSGRLLGRIGEKDPARNVAGLILPSPCFDVAAGRDGTLWAANTGNLRVEHFGPDGAGLGSWGKAAMTLDGFCGCCNPSHLALTPGGKFVTSEKGLPRVKVYDRDGEFECVVAGPDQFARDAAGLDVAVDSDGRVLVLDPAAGAVRIFERKK